MDVELEGWEGVEMWLSELVRQLAVIVLTFLMD